MGHSFGSSQVLRLAAHVEASEATSRQAARREGKKGEGEGRSEILGLVLLASAYHVPDGGNPVFALPLPVLTLIKPIISQVGGGFRVWVGGGSKGWLGFVWMSDTKHCLTTHPPIHAPTYLYT